MILLLKIVLSQVSSLHLPSTKPRLALSAGLSFIAGLLETALLYCVASIALAMSQTSGPVRFGPHSLGVQATVGQMVLVAGGLVIALLILSFPLSTLIASLSSRAMVRMRSGLLTAYLRSSIVYRDTHREGYLQQLMGEYSQRAENSLQEMATLCVTLCALSVVILGAILSTPIIAGGVLGGLALSSVLMGPLTKKLRKSTSTVSVNREVVGRVAQTTRLSEEISAFHVEGMVSDELGKGLRRAASAMHRLRYEGRLVPYLFQYGTLGIVILLIGILSVTSPDKLTGLAPLALLLVRALTYLRLIQRSLHNARETTPYIEALNKEWLSLVANEAPSGTIAIEKFGNLHFDDVSYEYKPGEPVLHNVSFEVLPGEMVGIVGPSGSGKSTLSGLILRLRMPTSGQVTVGGIALRDVTAESWSRLGAYVPQESRLVFGTVADNIRFFRDGFSDEQVMTAARAAHVHDEIMALPEGFGTLIGPGARGLSGGQRQRLSIARALLANPSLIVMDEPTSALDQRSELLVGQTLEELKGRTTIILIAHRPATLSICDRILRVTKGVLTEEQAPLAKVR